MTLVDNRKYVMINHRRWKVIDKGHSTKKEAAVVASEFRKPGLLTRIFLSKRKDWWIIQRKGKVIW